jgi:hypothetical protein
MRTANKALVRYFQSFSGISRHRMWITWACLIVLQHARLKVMGFIHKVRVANGTRRLDAEEHQTVLDERSDNYNLLQVNLIETTMDRFQDSFLGRVHCLRALHIDVKEARTMSSSVSITYRTHMIGLQPYMDVSTF